MKTFKKILSEVAQPKSAEEKRFKDQHTIELIKHPVALDSQFTGEVEGLTKKKRPADPAQGEDSTKYDAAYAVKDKQFKMPRNIDEEAELDEISKKTLGSYVKKAGSSMAAHGVAVGSGRNTDKSSRAMANRMKGMNRAADRLTKEEVELEEGRNEVLKSLEALAKKGGMDKKDYQKAHDLYKANKLEDLKKHIYFLDTEPSEMIADAIARNDSKTFNSMYPRAGSNDYIRSIILKHPVKEGITFRGLIDKIVTEDVNLNENPDEEIPMMMRQLHFIGYAADEILEYLAIDGLDPEEWWQNKLAYAFAQMKSLHAYVEGDKHMMGGDHDHDDIMAAYESVEEELLDDEELDEETLEEANFKPGNLKLTSKETVKLSMEDAKTLNVMMKKLNDKNRKEMEETLMSNKKGFNEILAFAKEAGV